MKRSKINLFGGNWGGARTPPFALRDSGAACRPPTADLRPPTSGLRGFTLIELLVAMAILMVIVLMLANLFQQSTRAWDSGLRQTAVGLEARAVMNMIQREASMAMPDEPYTFTGSSMEFTILNEKGEKMEIRYAQSGDSLSRRFQVGEEDPVTIQLVDNVRPNGFSVNNQSLLAGFPDVIEINLELFAESNTGRVRVYTEDDDGEIVADTDAVD